MQNKEQTKETIRIKKREKTLETIAKLMLLGGFLSLFTSLGLLIHMATRTSEMRDDVEQIRETLKQANERIEQYIAQQSLSTMDDLQKLDNIDED